MFGNFNLFALVAVMEGDDGTTRAIRRLEFEVTVRGDSSILVPVVAMDFKLLDVVGFVMDSRHVSHCGALQIQVKDRQVWVSWWLETFV